MTPKFQKQVGIRVPADLLAKLEARAKLERRPLAAMIRVLLEDGLKPPDAPKSAKRRS
jgi:hypothetical protein